MKARAVGHVYQYCLFWCKHLKAVLQPCSGKLWIHKYVTGGGFTAFWDGVGGILLWEALGLRTWCLESNLISIHECLPLGKLPNSVQMGKIRAFFPHKTDIRLRRYVHHSCATPRVTWMFLETQDSRGEEVTESNYKGVHLVGWWSFKLASPGPRLTSHRAHLSLHGANHTERIRHLSSNRCYSVCPGTKSWHQTHPRPFISCSLGLVTIAASIIWQGR